ncbi:hypothetical protein ACN082_04150 [Rothia sp. CCM 9417]|uniref:hypothetical protein n=1 Tax=Rothia sp. CCM 9417 TaxID=3402657 RepID=UPI003AE3C079
MSSTPKKAEGTSKNVAPSYLSDTFITDDGIEVPPPTRPMGPRRLSRYYDEAANYLRAVARGDDELPPPPMFMGKVEGLTVKADPSATLVGLSQMGSISTDEGELDIDYDHNQVTLVEDPLGHIGQQILGEPDDGQALGSDQTDFAAAPIEIGSDSDFISIEDLASGGDAHETAHENSEANDEPAAGEEAQEEAISPEEAEVKTNETADQADDAVAQAVSAPLATPALELPSPVRAIDAQGLDLTELDTPAQPAPSERALASETARAVESDSSEENTQVPEGKLLAESESDTSDEPCQADLVDGPDASVITGQQQGGTGALDLSADAEATDAVESASSEKPGKGGTLVAMGGIFLFLVALVLVWVVFYN